eukprot:13875087-Alexandrium_andersonii.AAC.1
MARMRISLGAYLRRGRTGTRAPAHFAADGACTMRPPRRHGMLPGRRRVESCPRAGLTALRFATACHALTCEDPGTHALGGTTHAYMHIH